MTATEGPVVHQLAKIFPYMWVHRGKLFASIFLALFVAGFWALNVSMTFWVVKVFLQEQTLAQYIDAEILSAEESIDEANEDIAKYSERLAEVLKVDPAGTSEKAADELHRKLRAQSDLSTATQKLLTMRWVQVRVLPWLPENQFNMLALIFGVLVISSALKGVCMFIQDVLIGNVVELATMAIRKRTFRKVLSLDFQTHSARGTAGLMSRFTYDMTVMGNGMKLMGGKVLREPMKAIACLALAFWVSWQLTLLAMLFVPLAGLMFHNVGRKLKRESHRLMDSMSRMYKTLEESFDAIKVVIAFNGAPRQRNRFHRENKEYFKKALRIVKIDSLTSPAIEVLGLTAGFVALLPGAYLVLRETREIWEITLVSYPMEVADLSLLYAALAGMIDPARKLSSSFTKLKHAAAATDRVFELMETGSLVKEPAEPKPLPRHSQAIEFRKVSFAYASHKNIVGDHAPVLDDVSLTVKAGEVIAVVGENGSGKSTLVNLLPRYYDPDSGQVLIDGVDLRDVRMRELRSQISVVTQETLLFDDTIYENIRYGRPGATRAEVEAAAHKAHVTQFLEQMPEGFATRVGEKGQRLSGGQRQRVALARAILRDPAILLLDEATSAIDSQSELLIHQTMKEFVKGRTAFLITHSVSQSILEFVTRIAVMDHGRLVAIGPHEVLIRTSPQYQKLYRAQVGQRSAVRVEADAHEAETVAPPERTTGTTARSDAPGSHRPHIFRLKIADDAGADAPESSAPPTGTNG